MNSRKKECNICKQQVTSSDNLYDCKNPKCPVKTHAKCEEESRKTDRFKRNFKKCGYCRTCKECNTLMGTVHASCHNCLGAVHVPCIHGQRRDRYTCRICRDQWKHLRLYTSFLFGIQYKWNYNYGLHSACASEVYGNLSVVRLSLCSSYICSTFAKWLPLEASIGFNSFPGDFISAIDQKKINSFIL